MARETSIRMADGGAAPEPGRPASTNAQQHPVARTVLGIVAGLLAVQLSLMPFSTGVHRDWAPLRADDVGGDAVTQRWYYEGIAESHYSGSGARLTGNPALPGRPTGIVMGDSYVEARQLPDRSTIGSVVERRARGDGLALNVRQYGFSGASSARYAVIAPDVLARWNPPFVAVVLTEDDFIGGAPFSGEYRLVVRPDSAVVAEHHVPARSATVERMRNAAAVFLETVTLADKVVVRATRLVEGIRGGAVTGGEADALARETQAVRASVQALHEAYGDRLAIVYVPDIAAVPADDRGRNEAGFLAACAAVGARCASAGAALRADREANHRISRGFPNSAPGGGHLNETGAAIVAQVLWSIVKPLAVPVPQANR